MNRRCAIAVLLSMAAMPACAQEVQLTTLFPAGGQVGTTVEVTLDAKGLPDVQRLYFARPGITAVKTKANRFAVTIEPSVSPGDVDVWALTAKGLTNPRRFAISQMSETTEKEPNDERKTAQSVAMPVVVHGMLAAGTDRDLYRLEAKAGQHFTLHFRSETLDGTARPALAILDTDGKEIMHSDGREAEPMLEFTALSDGSYHVQVEERSFQSGENNIYRLAITDGASVTGAFPHVLARGKTHSVTLFGHRLPGGKVVDAATQLEELAVSVGAPDKGDADGGAWMPAAGLTLDGFAYQHPKCYGAVRFELADESIVVELDQAHARQADALPLTIPSVLAGRFVKPREIDWYRLDAKKGELIWLEAVGERAGKIMDVELAIHDAKGQLVQAFAPPVLAKGETPPPVPNKSADPMGLWKVAEEGPHFLVVRDFFGSTRWGRERTYQVNVHKRHEEVSVAAVPGTNLAVLAGGKATLNLYAIRRGGHEGEIKVRALDLPIGLEIDPSVIPAKQTTATVTLTAKAAAAEWVGPITLVAETVVEGKPQTFQVLATATVRPGAAGVVRRSSAIVAAIVGKK